MAWGKVDDKLWGSPKWLGTPLRARGLWATALSYCMDQLTDGFVPAHVLPILGGTPKDAATLVRCGLWEVTLDGWLFHDWLDYQPSRESVLAERAAAAERQRRAREKAKEAREAKTKAVTAKSRRDSRCDKTVSHAHVTALVTVPPTRPDPTRPSTTRETSPSSSPPVTRKAAAA